MKDNVRMVGGFRHNYFYLSNLDNGQQLMAVDVGGRNKLHDFSATITGNLCAGVYVAFGQSVLHIVKRTFPFHSSK